MGAGGAGGISGGECVAASDCGVSVDAKCGKVECIDGACKIEINPGRLGSQKAGNCESVYCDPLGKVVALQDPSDPYNDGKQCTIDVCIEGAFLQTPYPDGGTCPETNDGVCYQGTCVECYDTASMNHCGGGLACDGVQCVPGHCTNDMLDAANGEMAKDCGGPCRPCDAGSPCQVGSDCMSGVCQNNACKAPSCADGVVNDGETGIDCGGPPSCPRCPAAQGCAMGTDCDSGVCWTGKCQPPKCDDGVKNGKETSEDCGGGGDCPDCPAQE
jgi:hypothetical protein